jgi:hypothetical protein
VVFALGVGVGLGRTVRASFTLTALGPFVLEVEVGVGVGVVAAVRNDAPLLFDDLTVVAAVARPPSVASTATPKMKASNFFMVKLLLR